MSEDAGRLEAGRPNHQRNTWKYYVGYVYPGSPTTIFYRLVSEPPLF